jgi:hypothetical protein
MPCEHTDKQIRYMWVHHPRIARRWAEEKARKKDKTKKANDEGNKMTLSEKIVKLAEITDVLVSRYDDMLKKAEALAPVISEHLAAAGIISNEEKELVKNALHNPVKAMQIFAKVASDLTKSKSRWSYSLGYSQSVNRANNGRGVQMPVTGRSEADAILFRSLGLEHLLES